MLTNRASPARSAGTANDKRELLLLRQRNGRLAITDDPSGFPGATPIDVRAILADEQSLNPELARGISTWLISREEKVQKSEACVASKAGDVPAFVKMNPQWVGAGFLALVLLVTPAIVRRFGGSEWRRVLVMGIPAVIFVTLVATFVVQLRQWQERVARVAHACDSAGNPTRGGVGVPRNAREQAQALQERMRALDDVYMKAANSGYEVDP